MTHHEDWGAPDEPAPRPVDVGAVIRGTFPANGATPPEAMTASDAPLFTLEPLDWGPILAGGIPKLEYLLEPYIPARRRIWAVGAAEAGKSIWAAWQASALTHLGVDVAYITQENGLEEEARRFLRLAPVFAHLRLYVDQGLDLTLPAHIGALFEATAGAQLCVFDTLSACWSGNEDSNAEVGALDRDVLKPLTVAGTSALVLDHTGNPQAFVKRAGVHAPRGASAKGQKADHLLEFRAAGDAEFTVSHGKARGAVKQPLIKYRVVDVDDSDGLDLEVIEATTHERAAEVADELVELIAGADDVGLTTTQLRAAAKGLGGKEVQTAALTLLENEDPPRVVVKRESIETGKGRQSAKVWRTAPETLFDDGAPDALELDL